MTTATQSLSAEDLILYQDRCVERAKAHLRERNVLTPVILVLTTTEGFGEARKVLAGAGMATEKLWGDRPEPGDLVVLVFPQDHTPQTLYAQTLIVPGRQGTVLPPLLEAARAAGVDDPYLRVMNGFRSALRLENGDLQAAFTRHVLRLTRALAYVRLAEFWIRHEAAPGEKKLADLSQDPDAQEMAIVNLETPSFQRTVLVPLERAERDTGKVLGFGEPQVLDSREGKSMSGRLFLVMQRPPAEKPN